MGTEPAAAPWSAVVVSRFERLVDRTGAHHLWLGTLRPGARTGRVRIGGKELPAHRVAWEIANGPLCAGGKVLPCSEEPACVRVEHLTPHGGTPAAGRRRSGSTLPRTRSRRGAGTMREIRPGIWELAVSVGRFSDGGARRMYRRIEAPDATAAAGELAAFVTEVRGRPSTAARDLRGITIDDAIEMYLTEHLIQEKGREPRTIDDYRGLHSRWFSPYIGNRPVRDVDEAVLDRIFGMMRKAGLSRSRMNQAKSLYAPFFRWAKRRQFVSRDPMHEFELPTSRYVSRERTPPEVAELVLLLNEAVTVVPDIAPLLALGAVTGMRRGELVGIRRSRILWDDRRIIVDTAVDESRRVKGTKTRRERGVHLDAESMAMLRLHTRVMDERATACGTSVAADAFLFSLEPDCSKPLHPDFVTKRVGALKEHLGIAEKSAAVVALEEEALRLFRLPQPPRQPGTPGGQPKGGLAYIEIGKLLGRSTKWAMLAIRSAERREAAGQRAVPLSFDGSILALRKFTSSELLDAGFNISVVASRQGHGPQVLVKHYSKRRDSAERKAAEHLGSVLHRRAVGDGNGQPD